MLLTITTVSLLATTAVPITRHITNNTVIIKLFKRQNICSIAYLIIGVSEISQYSKNICQYLQKRAKRNKIRYIHRCELDESPREL